MSISVTILRENGVDTCEGQVLARCCDGEYCADVPLGKEVKPGAYTIEEAARDPNLRLCLEVLSRQREKGIRRLEVCGTKSKRCPQKFVEYLATKFKGSVLLVGYNEGIARLVFSFTDGAVADREGRLRPYDFVDISNPYAWIEKVGVVVISPGALRDIQLIELVKRAKELGKPVVMYGVISELYKDLGIEHFCPFGLKK